MSECATWARGRMGRSLDFSNSTLMPNKAAHRPSVRVRPYNQRLYDGYGRPVHRPSSLPSTGTDGCGNGRSVVDLGGWSISLLNIFARITPLLVFGWHTTTSYSSKYSDPSHLLRQRLPTASFKDSWCSKDNLIETRTKIIVGAMP